MSNKFNNRKSLKNSLCSLPILEKLGILIKILNLIFINLNPLQKILVKIRAVMVNKTLFSRIISHRNLLSTLMNNKLKYNH